jgi:membrane-associated phospholipid phosphatase
MNIEKRIVIFLNSFHWKSLDFISEMISNITVLIVLWSSIILYSMTIDFRFGLNVLIKLILVFGVHYVISEGIIKYGAKKLSLQRKRPYTAYPNEIKGIGRNFSDSSFPSSHVSSVVGGLVILYSVYPLAWPALVLFAILLGLSRLHNGMHYPSDILAGIVLGLGYGWLTLFLSTFVL